MSRRVAMIRMHRAGLIELPPPRSAYRVPKRTFASPASDPKPKVELRVEDLAGLRVELVERGRPLALWNELIARYHYLGYRITPGAQLRYFINWEGELLGAMGIGGAAWKVAPRDRFIGWTPSDARAVLPDRQPDAIPDFAVGALSEPRDEGAGAGKAAPGE